VWCPGRGSFAAVEKKTPVPRRRHAGGPARSRAPVASPGGRSSVTCCGNKRKTMLLSLLATTPVLSDAQQNIMA